MNNWAELIWGLGIVLVSAIGGVKGNERAHRPYKMNICVMEKDGRKIPMEVWSDFVVKYTYHYPGTTCGKCGKDVKCPKEFIW